MRKSERKINGEQEWWLKVRAGMTVHQCKDLELNKVFDRLRIIHMLVVVCIQLQLYETAVA